MSASKYRHLLRYEELQDGNLDEHGNPLKVYEVKCYIRASIKSLFGQETDTGRIRSSVGSYQIETRYNRQIKPRGRLIGREKVFEISHVDNVDMENKKLRITATETR